MSEYTHVVINGSGYNLAYQAAANLAQYDRNNSSYNYDAQNRLTTSTVNGTTMTFKYDGLNRQVSRQVGNGTTYYSTWDGWDLVEDYHGNGVADATYLYGPTGLVKNLRTNNYYYQDGSGSTVLVASNNGTLREWYRYDLDGTPFFYNPNDTQRNPNQSGYGVRHLFTGQQWYQEIGLYDLRNRFYSPDLGRFLQPDPIGFRGGNNLYRYCGNNPVMRRDPSGLQEVTADEVVVRDTYIKYPDYPNFLGAQAPPNLIPWSWMTLANTIRLPSGYRVGNVSTPAAINKNTGQLYDPQNGQNYEPEDRVLISGDLIPEVFTAAWLQARILEIANRHSNLFGGDANAFMGKYLLPVDSRKIIAPVTREFSGYDVVPFGDAIYEGAGAYSAMGLGIIAGAEAFAGTRLANMPPPDLGQYWPRWDPVAYLRFIFQVLARNQGPPPSPRLPPPTDIRPPYVSGP